MPRRPFDLLAIGYAWAGVLNAGASLYWVIQHQPLRGAVVGVATPIWLMCAEVRRG